MEKNDLLDIINQISEIEPIGLSQIPDIDLYMDQVLTFLDEKLKNYKRTDDEKLLTKTMINNYSKDKVLPPPKNKKYSKDHIILLILVYHMKAVLTISDITKVLKLIEDDNELDLKEMYNSFVGLQRLESQSLKIDMEKNKKMMETLNISNETAEKVLTILSLIIDANIKKQLAQKMIDELK